MTIVIPRFIAHDPMCRRQVRNAHLRQARNAEQVGGREGKIKADGTLRGRSAGQAVVCTLLGTALSKQRHGAVAPRKPSVCNTLDSTIARNQRDCDR
jgi:hypothetical protein